MANSSDGEASGVESKHFPGSNESEAFIAESDDEQVSQAGSGSFTESDPDPILPKSLMIFVAGLDMEYPDVHINDNVKRSTYIETFSFNPERIFGEKGSIENLDDIVEELLDVALNSATDHKLDLSERGLGFMAADLGGMIVKKRIEDVLTRMFLLQYFMMPLAATNKVLDVSKGYQELIQWLSLQSDGIETEYQTLGGLDSLATFIVRSKSLESSIRNDRANLVSLEIEAELDGELFLSCFGNAIRQVIPEYPGVIVACSSLTSNEHSSLTEIGLLSNCLLQMLKQCPKLYHEINMLRFSHTPIPSTLARLADDFTSIDMAFRVIFDQVPHSCRVWARKALGFLCCSMRPMSIGELATMMVAADCENLDQLRENIDPGTAQYIVELLPGIVRIQSGKVYVAHGELNSFLSRNPGDWYYLEDYHSETALVCYHYLILLIENLGAAGTPLLEQIVQRVRCSRSYPGEMKDTLLGDRIFWLSSYASMYWCEHGLASRSDSFAGLRPKPWLKSSNRLKQLLTLRLYSKWPFDRGFKMPEESMPPDLREAVRMSEIDAFEMIVQLVDRQPSRSCLDLIYFPTSSAEEALGRWITANFTSIGPHEAVTLYPQVIEVLLEREKETILNEMPALLTSVALHSNLSFLMDFLGRIENEVDLREVSREALSYAVILGFVDIVKVLVSYQASPLGTFRAVPDTVTLLGEAVSTGNKEMVQLLLDAGADINVPDEAGFMDIGTNPLHVACKLGLVDMARLLLDASADANLPNANSRTALHVASVRGFASICELLIEHGANITTDAQLQTPLYHAARWYCKGSRYKKTTNILIGTLKNQFPGYREGSSWYSSEDAESLSRTVNTQTRLKKSTALVHVAIAGGIDVVSSMIEIGANVNIGDNYDYTALERAVTMGNMNMVRCLLDNGAQPGRKRGNGESLLHIASATGKNEVIEELLKLDIPVDHLDEDSYSPLAMAVMWKIVRAVEQLIPRSSKETISMALIFAALYGYHEILNMLLDAGADINHQDNFGNTPLQISCWSNHPRVTRILLARIPDINRPDNNKYTPLSDAARKGAISCLKLLLDAGADMEIENVYGKRPLIVAAEADSECFEILLERGAQAVLPEDIRRPEIHLLEDLSFLAGIAHAYSPRIVRAYAEYLKSKVSDDAFLSETSEALAVAAWFPRRENVRLLLEYGADPNYMVAKFNVAYGSAIGMALLDINTVRQLLDNSIKPVDLNKVDDYRNTPLQLLAFIDPPNIKEMLELLLAHGADPTIISGNFGTILNAACLSRHDNFDRILNLPRVSRDTTDDLGRLPLHIATQTCPADERVDLLTTEKSTFRSTDKQGRNALHYAATGNLVNRVDKVLNECPDLINTADRDGWTALHWACRQDDVSYTTECLIRHGANREAKSHDGWTPRHVAIYYGNTEHLDFLPEESNDIDDEGLPSEAAEMVAEPPCGSVYMGRDTAAAHALVIGSASSVTGSARRHIPGTMCSRDAIKAHRD
ncbi:hypothetical protein Daesc_003980 [Daldinia eschscholtzii]|uniref:Ankyrin n=1 Tax=Daldinia eschscholtzii TaxID=292717 RepID=A0AAX6MN00_9PEZI